MNAFVPSIKSEKLQVRSLTISNFSTTGPCKKTVFACLATYVKQDTFALCWNVPNFDLVKAFAWLRKWLKLYQSYLEIERGIACGNCRSGEHYLKNLQHLGDTSSRSKRCLFGVCFHLGLVQNLYKPFLPGAGAGYVEGGDKSRHRWSQVCLGYWLMSFPTYN